MKLSEFYEELQRHDWYYSASDDHSVWKRGVANEDRLSAIAEREGKAHIELMKAFHNYYFSGEPWGTERAPYPEKPVD